MQPESLGDALARPWIPIRELIGSGLLIEEGKAVIYGVFKSGKSTLMSYIALSAAAGLPLFNDKRFTTQKSRVLSLQLEMGHRSSLRRYRDSSLSQLPDARDNLFPWTEPYLKLDTDDGRCRLQEELERIRPDIVIIDPLYKCLSGSENSVEDLTRIFDNLDLLISQYHFSLIFTAQGRKTQIIPGKGKIDLGDEELRGSTAIGGWVDSIIGLRYGGDTKRVLSFSLRHGDPSVFNVVVDYDPKTCLYRVI